MLAFVLPLLSVVCATIVPARAQSVVTYYVTDPLTGIGIYGWDPVSYFTETVPLMGQGQYEYIWKNVPWYFATAANRDIFKSAPEIYAPQFGGHGAMGVARGYVSDSDPKIFVLFKQRLYLFYSASTREAFLLAPDDAASEAEARWPELSKHLSIN
ncbi:MAG: YHS domain-containing (seleno)protein [Candidatus Devosia phytovorans]|uniref:YHS domain-containing (Seleno)protein n=1 Tax=Candidatus Devosia phytovorans TaxID=3121372 RepID=A0AAJ6B0Q2_9HYPH|nr:YHS domain-containing (seleno)protein [Devosia sp.]WEK04956.1 MAG: YHS domain-containing (seleno)protein [Devosia sp.]